MRTNAIRAPRKYLANDDELAVYIASRGGGDVTEHRGNYVIREVSIHDARQRATPTSLDLEGFELASQPTRVDDFYDDARIADIFDPEVKALVSDITGAARVEIFDHTKRSSSVQRQEEMVIREAASIIHNDYTARSGVKRLRDHFADDPDEAERLLKRRFAIINVWRSIAGPVCRERYLESYSTKS